MNVKELRFAQKVSHKGNGVLIILLPSCSLSAPCK